MTQYISIIDQSTWSTMSNDTAESTTHSDHADDVAVVKAPANLTKSSNAFKP